MYLFVRIVYGFKYWYFLSTISVVVAEYCRRVIVIVWRIYLKRETDISFWLARKTKANLVHLSSYHQQMHPFITHIKC